MAVGHWEEAGEEKQEAIWEVAARAAAQGWPRLAPCSPAASVANGRAERTLDASAQQTTPAADVTGGEIALHSGGGGGGGDRLRVGGQGSAGGDDAAADRAVAALSALSPVSPSTALCVRGPTLQFGTPAAVATR